MTDRMISVAGPTMHTGWMKKISALEEQNRQRQREIIALTERLRLAEEKIAKALVIEGIESGTRWVPAMGTAATPAPPQTVIFADNAPVKRGPGRPRKNPQ